jgi:hypothetical protein
MTYILPDGRHVEIHDDVARGALLISYQLKGGKIVYAVRADESKGKS